MKIEIKEKGKPGEALTIGELLISLQIALAEMDEQTKGRVVKVKGVQLYLSPLDADDKPVFLPRPPKKFKDPKEEIKDVITVEPYRDRPAPV